MGSPYFWGNYQIFWVRGSGLLYRDNKNLVLPHGTHLGIANDKPSVCKVLRSGCFGLLRCKVCVGLQHHTLELLMLVGIVAGRGLRHERQDEFGGRNIVEAAITPSPKDETPPFL